VPAAMSPQMDLGVQPVAPPHDCPAAQSVETCPVSTPFRSGRSLLSLFALSVTVFASNA
jgi:hypothetical protein